MEPVPLKISRIGTSSHIIVIKKEYALLFGWKAGDVLRAQFVPGGPTHDVKAIATYRGPSIRVLIPKHAVEEHGFKIGDEPLVPLGDWMLLRRAEPEPAPAPVARAKKAPARTRAVAA